MLRNRKREPFDWENEELAETLTEPEEPIYLEVLAEVPGLVLESDLPDVDDAVAEPPPPTEEQQAAAALENAGITPNSDIIRGITGVHRDTQGVDSDLFSGVTTILRRNEMTNRPNLIPPSDEGINPPPLVRRVEVEGIESDDENKDDNEYEESDNSPSTNLGGGARIDENAEAAPQLGRGTRVRNPPDYYQADFTNMKYAYPEEANVINTCFQGAGCGAKDKLKTECRSAADHIDRGPGQALAPKKKVLTGPEKSWKIETVDKSKFLNGRLTDNLINLVISPYAIFSIIVHPWQ